MPVYKCKMCERDLEAEADQSLCVCGFCGTSQTLPTSDNDQVIAMLSRGNHLRQLCEFDKAAVIYEKLLKDIHNDPEIYWQLALCRYGILYVKEPQVNIMIPSCRRARYKSILCDSPFLEAMDRSDILRRDAYRKEAEYIDVMQKKLLKNVGNIHEKPKKNKNSSEEELTAGDFIRRGNLCLEKRKWADADGYFNRAIAASPQDPSAYLGKLLVECELEDAEKIPELRCDLSFSDNYRTALRLGCTELEMLNKQSILNRGAKLMKSAQGIEQLTAARELFSKARGCENAETMFVECSSRIEAIKEEEYQKACRTLTDSLSFVETERARDIFISLENYKDSPLKVQECTELLLRNDYAREAAYRKGIRLMDAAEFHSDYDHIAGIFNSLDNYKDSPKMLKKCLRKRRLLSLSIVVKLMFIAGVCYAVPRLIDKI